MRKLSFIWLFLLAGLFSLLADNEDYISSEKNIVYCLPIFSDINSTSWVYTQRAFDEAYSLNATAIIIHLNTYGGEVVFGDSIQTKALNSTIPVHVFIDNNAASAGALISIACKKIFMRPGAKIGAATVVNQTGEQMPDKYQSYMRGTIRATAEAHGKDTIIAEGDTIIKWVRDPQIAEAMVDDRIFIPGIIDSAQILTFTAREAMEHGYCDGIANNIEEVINLLGIENHEIVTFTPTFYDGIKGFLSSPIFRGLLILLIIGGIYFELQSPGIGFPIAISITAAILYFAPLYIDGLAANWEIIIFIIGIILIVLEVFAFPGFGIAGISGIILAVTGLILSLLDNVVFDFSGVDANAFFVAALTVICGMVGAVILSVWLSQKLLIQTSGPFSKIALHSTQEIESGFVGVDASMGYLIGKDAISLTVLRPSGKILIDNEQYDARAIEGFIEKDEHVRVISFSSGQLNVRKI